MAKTFVSISIVFHCIVFELCLTLAFVLLSCWYVLWFVFMSVGLFDILLVSFTLVPVAPCVRMSSMPLHCVAQCPFIFFHVFPLLSLPCMCLLYVCWSSLFF